MEAAAALGSSDQVTVMVVDDHARFIDTVEALLSGERQIAIVGRAENGEDAVRVATRLRPDVVLMDINMPILDGFGAARRIRELLPETCVLFLTGSDAPRDLEEAQRVGASGYLTKDRIASELVRAIFAAAPPCTTLS